MHLLTLVTLIAFAQQPAVELFRDPHFVNGFNLTAASHPAPKVEIGILETEPHSPPAPPEWRIAQWATRILLEPSACTRDAGGAWVAENPAKRIEVQREAGGLTRLLLESRSIAEYAGTLRVAGQPWPHLLIEQSFLDPIRLDALARLDFSLAFRVAHCRVDAAFKDMLDPGLHTAQASAYWTVHDLSTPERDMFWFGIPLFDARFEIPPANYALDIGKDDATGKFICVLPGDRFWTGPTGDGQWRSLQADLLPLLREALQISQQHGHLLQATLKDLALTSFNLGWEMPGPYDAAIEFRGLALRASRQ